MTKDETLHNWSGLTDADRKSSQLGHNARVKHHKRVTKREWVGLTEEERNSIEDYSEMMIGKPAFDAIEAKLKEKNYNDLP
jgi:phage gpG-like protein